MIFEILLTIGAVAGPPRLHVTTTRGASDIPLVQRGDGPLVALPTLARAIGASVERDSSLWVTLNTTNGSFRFLPGTGVMQDGATMRGLPATSWMRHDTLFVSLAFVAEILADPARRVWTWAPAKVTLSEGASPLPLAAHASRTTLGGERRTELPNGLRPNHRITLDPGHGGTDSGNPGMFFPHGLKEKDVTLAVSLLVRDELEKKGIRVTMTRTRDTLINLEQRAPRYCQGDCDLFVSVHVNSLNPRPGYTRVRGFETYFLSEARSADAARVASMENAAIRFDQPGDRAPTSGLDFMFKDLQTNEFLRESQHAAALIQSSLGEVHDGGDKGVKQAGFAVLRTARRPSVLIEMGYSTNRDDAELMTTPHGQRDLAAAIARAIVSYLRSYDQETTDTSVGSSQ